MRLRGVAHHLVAIEPSPTDGRSRILTLTPEGHRAFARAAPLWREAQRQFSVLNGETKANACGRTYPG
jgi:DNA-binding MarR family transcriptional regulator